MDSLTVQLNRIINEYNEHVQDVADNAVKDISKEAVQRLRNSSPKKTGDYAQGWAVKHVRGRQLSVVVYNRKAPGLTHLLENGHRIVNAKGEWGRVNGIKHIKPVEEWAYNELQVQIERELK